MGRQHLQGGLLVIRQEKTGTLIEMSTVLPELQGELDELPAHQLTFLMTEQGKAITAAGFGNWFRDMAADAGLPAGFNTGTVFARQVRRAVPRPDGLITRSWPGAGWKSLSEVQRYRHARTFFRIGRPGRIRTCDITVMSGSF